MKERSSEIIGRTGGLILSQGHRKANWYWHQPLRPGQVIALYNHFKDEPQPKK